MMVPVIRTLDELALKFGTDKSSKGHAYTKYYEMFFEPLRERYLNLLEIGIWEAASLKLWEAYFPNARIAGFDIDPKDQYRTERISTIVGDQSKVESLKMIQICPAFDIIIDDGSHQSDHQILTFETLFPYLNSGGLFIIEDILCAFDSRWTPNPGHGVLDRIRQMIGEVNMGGAIPNSHICANKQDAVTKYQAGYFEANIEFIFVACGIVFIKKM